MFDLAIFTALGWERRAVTGGLLGEAPGPDPGTWCGRLGDGASCVVVQTGIGQERARTAAARLPPAGVFLACGCAGGLAAWLRAGDLVVAGGVQAVGVDGRPSDLIVAESDALVTWAASRGFRVHRGLVTSTLGVLDTGAAKRAAGAAGALVVEMESAAIAAEARGRGVPFVGLRVVLDDARQSVPLPPGLMDEGTGEIRAGRTAAVVSVRPWLWPALGRLGRQQRVAARKLGAFMTALLRDGGMDALTAGVVRAAAAGGAEEGI